MNNEKITDLTEASEQEKVTNRAGLPALNRKANVFNTIPRTISMMREFLRGQYKVVPAATIIGLIGGALYLALPADVLPDVVPLLGYLDDAAVLAIFLNLCQHDLSSYNLWKEDQMQKTETE